MHKLITLIAFLLLSSPVYAQVHIIVEADRVKIGPEFVRRFAQFPGNHFIAPAGQTVTLPSNSTFDAIEVSGVLRVLAGTYNFTHLQVLPGGKLEVIIPCGQNLVFNFRDIPIDTTIDPFQWGNSILIFGLSEVRGCQKLHKINAVGDLAAGITSLPISSLPANWNAGDKLLIPDTRQQPQPAGFGSPNSARREPTIRILATTINSITTDTPLTFEHNVIRYPNGNEFLTPRIANLTRNILIQSENRNNPGHIAFVGHDTHNSIFSYVELFNIGRTCNGPLNNTPPDLISIGTCQAGRYTLHFHHAGHNITAEGNSLHGATGKWGITLHQTSDSIIRRNITLDFLGAGIVTEDGNEVRNVIEENFSAYHDGDGTYRPGGLVPEMVGLNRPGSEGTGIWGRGVKNIFRKNESWNNRIGEVQNHVPIAFSYPSAPGVFPFDTPIGYREVPIEHSDNIIAGSLVFGFDQWAMKTYPITRLKIANGVATQLHVGPISDQIGFHLVDSEIVNPVGSNTTCLGVAKAYVSHFRMEGGGCYGQIWADGGGGLGNVSVNIFNATFYTDGGINMPLGAIPDGTMVLDSINFAKPNMWPIVYGPMTPWVPGTPSDLVGCQHQVRNYFTTGLNYCLQLGEVPLPPDPVNCTLSGWTNGPEIITNKTAIEILSSMTRTRVVLVPESNGGTCDGPLSETFNYVTPIGTPLPSSVNSEVTLPDGTIYRGTIQKVN